MGVRRTRIEVACTMISRTALFTDETNIAVPGAKAAERQTGTVDNPLRIIIDVPPQVRSGRVTVHLSLEFECGERRVYDTTRPTAFMLLIQAGLMRDPHDNNPVAAAILLGAILIVCGGLVGSFVVEITIYQIDGARAAARAEAMAERDKGME